MDRERFAFKALFSLSLSLSLSLSTTSNNRENGQHSFLLLSLLQPLQQPGGWGGTIPLHKVRDSTTFHTFDQLSHSINVNLAMFYKLFVRNCWMPLILSTSQARERRRPKTPSLLRRSNWDQDFFSPLSFPLFHGGFMIRPPPPLLSGLCCNWPSPRSPLLHLTSADTQRNILHVAMAVQQRTFCSFAPQKNARVKIFSVFFPFPQFSSFKKPAGEIWGLTSTTVFPAWGLIIGPQTRQRVWKQKVTFARRKSTCINVFHWKVFWAEETRTSGQ